MRYIKIGKIVNTHGIKGEIRLLSNFKFKDRVFVRDMVIYIGKDKIKEVINSYRPHKQFDMITLIGYNNINDILKYKGLDVYINEEDLSLNNDEYLDEDLINCKVIVGGITRGIIKSIEDYKVYKLIIVNNNEIEYLVPYVSDIIEGVDLKKKEICFKSDIEGLFK